VFGMTPPNKQHLFSYRELVSLCNGDVACLLDVETEFFKYKSNGRHISKGYLSFLRSGICD
jgi:hypothetical protein